jgi:hypothetical protein
MSTEIIGDCPRVFVQQCFGVANFSCPREYVFDDGSVLAACSLERVARLAPDEGQHQFSRMPLEVGYRDDDDTWCVVSTPYGVKVQTGREDWILSAAQCAELDRLEADEEINIVIVSVETMALLREFGRDLGKCRTAVRVGHSGRLFSAKYFGG